MLIVFVCLRRKGEKCDWKSDLQHDRVVFFLRNIESGFLSWVQTSEFIKSLLAQIFIFRKKKNL